MSKPAITRKLRCAIYTRKSSEEGLEQEFNSLHAQREACEAYVASQRSEGWALILIGNAIGLGFAALVLGLSVVSLPMLVDCDISAADAVSTSWRAARANPGVMFRWGVTVAALLVIGSIPLFVGLAAVLPWLGYATWHLYTKLVDRSAIKSRRD